MHAIISQDLVDSYEAVNPPHIIIHTEETFDEELLSVIRRMPEVREAEGRRNLMAKFRLSPSGEWHPLQILAVPDYEDIRIGKVKPELVFEPDPHAWPSPAVWPPPEQEMLLERTSLLLANLGLTRAHQGDTILVETFTGRQRQVRLAGLCYDFSRIPATSAGMAYGYVTFDTVEWLGMARGFDELYVLASGDPYDWEHVKRMASAVRDRVERGGYTVLRTEVPEPGKLPLDRFFRAFTLILGVLGSFVLFLAAFLEINTISALMVRHTRQIGMMKAIGARTFQIIKMYLGLTAIFGLLSLIISVPLAAFVARHAIDVMAYFINFKLGGFSVPPQVVLMEVLLALLVPTLSALYPVIAGSHITVREAISHYGLGDENFGAGLIDRLVGSVRKLPRPLLLSLRNTFRRKGRMLLTLATLTLGGAIFITVPSVRSSLDATMDEGLKYWQFDGRIQFMRPYRIERIEHEVLRISGIVEVEGWGSIQAHRIRSDGSEGEEITLEAPPAETKMLQPDLIAGRWLLPEDEHALVISSYLWEQEPDISVGDEIVLKVKGRETPWRVVGVVKAIGPVPIAYVNYPYFATMVREVGSVGSVQFVTERHDADFQESVLRLVVQHLESTGIRVASSITSSGLRAYNAVFFNIIATLLMIMAVLMAIVGGLGLMGTVSLNVLEQTREIGVMRAVGASHSVVMQIFITEGLFIGLLSWFIGTILSLPIGKLLSDAVGMQLLRIPLNYAFSLRGVIAWLALVSILSALASYLPVQRATQVSVRDALVYE
jgi:putative ABC transport system permease protein